MKRSLLLILLLLCLSHIYAAGKKVYFWVDYPNSAKYGKGLTIRINHTEMGRIVPDEFAIIYLIGDKKYTVELLDQDHVVGQFKIDTLTDEVSYYSAQVKIKGSSASFSSEKVNETEGRAFVRRDPYSIRMEMYEEGLNEVNSNGGGDYGSAFLISADGYIATNYHVVDGYKTIKVKGVEGNFTTEYDADVVVKDINNDLVILRLKDKTVKFSTPPYMLKTQGASTGEEISVLGYPFGPSLGEEIKLTTGVISAKSGVGGNASSYQISAAAQPGNSGGPLLDSHGNILGIVNAKIMNAENITYAVKAVYLQTLITMLPDEIHQPETNTIADKTLPQKVAAVSKFVYIIRCK